eukprot:1423500-Rhodomonas_salina.1
MNDSSLPVACVLIQKVGKLHTLQIDNYTVLTMADDPTCFSEHCGNLSLEELIHQLMAHVLIPKLAKMSHMVYGLPCVLHFLSFYVFPVRSATRPKQSVSLI